MSVLRERHPRRLARVTALLLTLLLGACASLPDVDEVGRTASYRQDDVSGTRLYNSLQSTLAQHPGQSGFHTLPWGEDAFIARMRLVRAADKTLDLQYYIWHEDLTGSALFHSVMAAADRGVRVRLLLDDLNTADMDETLRLLDAHGSIEVRLFNPFANREHRIDDIATDSVRINHRMHNKTLTVDGIATVFGGRNVGDEYFAANTEVIFGDMDALAVGPIAMEVSDQFDLYWNSDYAYPIATFYRDAAISDEQLAAYRLRSEDNIREMRASQYADALKQFDLLREDDITNLDFAWSDWVLAYDQPGKVETREVAPETHLLPKLKQGMDMAQRDLMIVSPYFVPGEELTEYLVGLVDKGVRVRILTNSLLSNDVSAVHAGYIRYREDLVEGGVEMYELRADAERQVSAGPVEVVSERSSLHAKFFVFDEHWLWVGSYNMDGRSTIYNTELGAYFANPEVARKISRDFDQILPTIAFRVQMDDQGDLQWVTLRDGQEEILDQEPDTTWWQRTTTGVLKVIVPEKQL